MDSQTQTLVLTTVIFRKKNTKHDGKNMMFGGPIPHGFFVDLNRKQIDAKPGTTLLNWLTTPGNDLEISFNFVRRCFSIIACTFESLCVITEIFNLNPNHSLSCLASLHFPPSFAILPHQFQNFLHFV